MRVLSSGGEPPACAVSQCVMKMVPARPGSATRRALSSGVTTFWNLCTVARPAELRRRARAKAGKSLVVSQ
jgi:hypothetical protein